MCKDIKRLAACTGECGRYDIQCIELSPAGLAATNGRLLCVINAPGWPYHCLLDPKDLKKIDSDAALSVNGSVQFTSTAHNAAVVPHKNPDEVSYPRWQKVLPEACCLQPMTTLNIAYLKRLLSALQRTPESSVTLYVRPDECTAPILLCNEAGDMGILTPITFERGNAPVCHFPTDIYRHTGRASETLSPVFTVPIEGELPASVSSSLLGS